MVTTSDFRNGLCIEIDHNLYMIVDFQHVKPGKGNAFVRTKLKNINDGRITERTFSAGHKVNDIRIEKRSYQFLYSDASGYHFMDENTFEQLTLQEKLIDAKDLLKEGQVVSILIHVGNTEKPIGVDLPPFVELEVVYTEPGERGDTATAAKKPAKLETGAEIQVPLFISQNEIIRVDTRTREYCERVQK